MFFSCIHKVHALTVEIHESKHSVSADAHNLEFIKQGKLGMTECDHLIVDIHEIHPAPNGAIFRYAKEIHQAALGWGTARITYRLSDTMKNEVAMCTWLLQHFFPASEAPSGTRVDYELDMRRTSCAL